MKKCFQSLIFTLFTMAILSSCADSNSVEPTFDGNVASKPILPRGSLITSSQLENYANMTYVSEFASGMEYLFDNLEEDMDSLQTNSTEEVLLARMNAWLTLNSYSTIGTLPSYCFTGDEVADMPALAASVQSVLEDAEDILNAHANDLNGPYDEFKYFIENLDVDALPDAYEEQVATILYTWDILLNFLEEEDPILALNWLNFIRCTVITVGTAVGVSIVATPIAGIAAGAVVWAQTDLCFEI